MSETRVMPLPKVTGIWEHDFSTYPDIVRVPMSDGKVVNYYRDIDQPAPVLGKLLDHYNLTCQVGYKSRVKRLGRRRKDCNGDTEG